MNGQIEALNKQANELKAKRAGVMESIKALSALQHSINDEIYDIALAKSRVAEEANQRQLAAGSCLTGECE